MFYYGNMSLMFYNMVTCFVTILPCCKTSKLFLSFQLSRYDGSRLVARKSKDLLQHFNAMFAKYGFEDFLSVFNRELKEHNTEQVLDRQLIAI